MNTLKNEYPYRATIVFRLWGLMMLLILIAVAFMWVVQIYLFEQNYVDAAVEEINIRLQPITSELQTADLFMNNSLVDYAVKSVKGKVILFSGDGTVISSYSNGHLVDTKEISEFVSHLQQSSEYRMAIEGDEYQIIAKLSEGVLAYEMGIPVTWQGGRAVLFISHPIDEINRVQAINRKQLVNLSLLLAFSSGIVALALSRQFVKPIHTIKETVERLAEGDLSAQPPLQGNDEFGALSHSVIELGQALQRTDVLRKEVIANVSHELRSPLSLIIGYGEMVRDVSWPHEQLRNENLNLIISEAKRMSTMVDDILDYSQFQAGYIQLHRAEYNLCDIIESEIELARQITLDYGIEIIYQSYSNEAIALVDALKISQVMRNLLNNAINHTDDNQVIYVSIIRDDKDKKIKVTVCNPGNPIAEEKLKMIWERYYSGQHQGSRKQGTGIGLSIVSTLLDAHGFQYGVYYSNGYNVFWFEIM